ncbi:hypothetical protein Hdeb2414_s0022g00610841 [Helianthus debilis subsp. tardiflorus]
MKKFVHPYWFLLMHMFIMCMTKNRGGTNQLNITQSAAFVCLVTNQAYNYLKYVFEGMKRNITRVRKDKFVMYPRFLQMIFNAHYSDLERIRNTLDLKPMGPAFLGALTPGKGTASKFEGRIALEKFGQFAETEEVVAEPENAPINVPVNVVVAEEHIVQIVSNEEPELPLEAEVSSAVSIVQPVFTAESLAQLLKSVTENIGNPPLDPLIQSQEPVAEDPKDSDSRPRVIVKQVHDQPVIDEDDDGLYDFDFETDKDTTETPFEFATTATATETDFDFETIYTRMDVDPDSAEVSSRKRPEEPLKMSFVDDSSDDEFISIRELKKRILVLEQDSIHKDAKIIQLEVTIIQKNQQIDQLQGDVSLLFNIVYDIRGKLEKKFGHEFADPTNTERQKKAAEDRAREIVKDNAERSAAMKLYFNKPVDKEKDKAKAKRLKQKREPMIVKNRNLNPVDPDVQVTHHVMDVGESHYDKVGNISDIVSWGFDHDWKMWWIKRKIGPVEYYGRPAQFQTMKKVDLTILSNAPYANDKPGGRGYLFF